MTDAAIETRGLTRRFADRTAVDDLTLSVPSGQVYCLLGANGSGKTTTIRLLTTLLPPTAGTALVAGADVRRRPTDVRSRIGVALQQTGLDPLLTGRQLLGLQAALHGLRGRSARIRIEALLDALRLGEHADTPTRRLSGGLRRRVDLAVALVNTPVVLFLDEPTTGLDPHSCLDLWTVVEERAAAGTTVILTTQYLHEADRLAHRVGILREGVLVASAPTEQLKRQVGERALVMTLADDACAARAAQELTRRGEEVVVVPGGQVRVRLEGQGRTVAGDDAGRRLMALYEEKVAVTAVESVEPTLQDVYLRYATA
jgi:ABC-2 type transport system ATP-binding protein